eukprot:TRINITY_DN12874_c0_g1_i1.p1 TRINITY_DN12874_c0_g1~~TRINITY_DN12874_c0_g1_i1.p1  ORF type:complete len:179 (+),score=30.28 TRINITY_DN12874_c0_g1_i1:68-538(+)
MVGLVESYLRNNATIQEVEARLTKFCAGAPASFQKSCDDLTTLGFYWVEDYIENRGSPAEVCTKMKLCKSPKITRQNNPACPVCETLVAAIRVMQTQQLPVAQIQAKLKYFCSVAPSFEPTCVSDFVNGLPQILTWLNQGWQVPQVCQQLNLCDQQ